MEWMRADWTKEKPPRLRVSMTPAIYSMMCGLSRDVQEVLSDPERSPEVIDRLFPPAYESPELEAEHRRLLGETMFERRRTTLEAYDFLLSGGDVHDRYTTLTITQAEANLVLQVINDYRLILATELDVQDNDWRANIEIDEGNENTFNRLSAASEIQEILVQALMR